MMGPVTDGVRDGAATVTGVRPAAWETVEMTLRLEDGIDPRPGQFAHVGVNGAFLRRPVSIAGYDANERSLRLIVQRVGRGTRALTDMLPGGEVRVLAPLGNPFPLDAADPQQGEAWLVGGGVGVAPLLYLAKALAERGGRVRTFAGFRDDQLAFGLDELERCGRVEPSVGGFVTDLLARALEEGRPSVLYACGPDALLRRLQEICRRHGLAAWISLEEHMGCGIGACLVCSCKIRAQSAQNGYEYQRVCYDGPVFDLSKVVFE